MQYHFTTIKILRMIFCLALIVPGGLLAETPLAEHIKIILEATRQKYGTMGMVATVIQNGVIAETVVAGYADRENNRLMSPSTLVPAASLTKLITAVLVMRQVEIKQLDLDRPANDYLPGTLQFFNKEGKTSAASLRQLLSHSSGLPVSWQPIAMKGDRVESLESYLSHHLMAIYDPGERIIYANDAFSLAGVIAAGAEKEEFAAHAARVLLRPLHMETSTFVSPWSLPKEKLARAYGSLMGGNAPSEHNDVTAALPAGGLISTAPEFARFALMLLRQGELDGVRIISSESVSQLWTIQARPYPTARTGFGLAFGIQEAERGKIVWWDGGLAGAANRMLLHPASRSGVVVFSNLSNNAASSEAANAILDLLVPPPVLPRYTPTAAELARFSGSYRFYDAVDPSLWFLRYGIDLKITPQNGSLRYDSRLLQSGVLLPLAPGLFRLSDSRLAGADVYFDGETVYFLDLTARRISWYNSAPAMAIYALLAILMGLYLFYRLLRAGVRRLRARRR